MKTLLLSLSGPMQSWGDSSRFVRRTTGRVPTKSGLLGLLAAAQGRRRTDSIEELLALRFGVRVDQPGRIERDFQTAVRANGKPLPLTDRFYLTDAKFLAAVEGNNALIEGLDEALRNPVFPLYLGRRSCPPDGPVSLGLRDERLWPALSGEPWRAARWWRKRQAPAVHLEVHLDAALGEGAEEGRDASEPDAPHAVVERHDVPLSFDPESREYGWRSVEQRWVEMANPDSRRVASQRTREARETPLHDPFSAFGGA